MLSQKITIEYKAFARFLKNEGAYRAYVFHMLHLGYHEKEYYHFFATSDAYCFLSRPFLWSNTHEGDSFWRKLNAKWLREWLNVGGDYTIAKHSYNDIMCSHKLEDYIKFNRH